MSRWLGYQAKVIDAEQRSRFAIMLASEAAAFVTAVATVAVLVLGGLRVMDGAISIGVLLAFYTLLGSFLAPVLSLVGVGGQLQQVRGMTERLDDITRYKGVTRAVESGRDMKLADVGIELRDISFGYGPLAPPFIDGLSLRLPPRGRSNSAAFLSHSGPAWTCDGP